MNQEEIVRSFSANANALVNLEHVKYGKDHMPLALLGYIFYIYSGLDISMDNENMEKFILDGEDNPRFDTHFHRFHQFMMESIYSFEIKESKIANRTSKALDILKESKAYLLTCYELGGFSFLSISLTEAEDEDQKVSGADVIAAIEVNVDSWGNELVRQLSAGQGHIITNAMADEALAQVGLSRKAVAPEDKS